MKILVGTPIHRNGAIVLEYFLSNQQQIQQNEPGCDLVFSTDDPGYVDELKNLIRQWRIRANVILSKVNKPAYARDRIWNIASSRESIRLYFINNPDAEKLLFIDADMTCDPNVIRIMEKEIIDHDAVFSGYRFRNGRIGLAGTGCLFLKRKALEKIRFRCYEFKNGQVINEDNVMEMDLFRKGCLIKKGFFLSIDHYSSAVEAKHINPGKVGFFRKITTGAFIRYCFFSLSVAIHYNIPTLGQRIIWFFQRFLDRLRGIKT
jgi:hypothetical protein